MRDDLTTIGYVARVHGTGGQVVIQPESEHVQLFSASHVYYLRVGKRTEPARMESVKLVRKGDQTLFFVHFEHITNRTDAESIRGATVLLPQELVPETDKSEHPELTGFSVVASDGEPIGEIIDVLENPAHPLIQIKDPDGTFLVPFVDRYILKIDSDNAIVVASDLTELKNLGL